MGCLNVAFIFYYTSICLTFACAVGVVIFVLSYSRPLTQRVCPEGSGERMERVHESFHITRQREKEMNSQTEREKKEEEKSDRI